MPFELSDGETMLGYAWVVLSAPSHAFLRRHLPTNTRREKGNSESWRLNDVHARARDKSTFARDKV
eukprot:scaffold116841_cov29-Prasinocladus_malaysianus.AAC.2